MGKKEKFAFTIGFSVGVASALLTVLAVSGGLYVKNNGCPLSWGSGDSNDVVVQEEHEDGLIIPHGLDLPEEKISGVWTRGSVNAPVTILEYSDYQCPYCSRHHNTLKQIMETYPKLVKWEYKHFPLDSLHPHARKAAEAAECAGDQEEFWSFSDYLFANQKSINNSIYEKIAKRLNLDIEEFNSCLNSSKYSDKVTADFKEGKDKGVQGTPGNFVNGLELKGAVPFEQLKTTIDKALEQ